jgi:large subunit ribosomal protein L31
MKTGIHPEYFETTIRCSCGHEIHTRATKKDIRIDTCSACHPFFTGKARMLDTEGRVQRFMKKYGGKDTKRPY